MSPQVPQTVTTVDPSQVRLPGRYTGATSPAVDAPGRINRDILVGSGIAALFFVGFLGWAAFMPLQAATYARGTVAVAGNRQAVQHREGGIVSALHVQDGQRVSKGQVLMELSAGETRANERAMAGQYLTLLAQRARLDAEQRRAPSITIPPEFATLSPEEKVLADDAMRLQKLQFSARGSSLGEQQSVIRQSERQLSEQISGYQRQLSANSEQQKLIADELDGVRKLNQQGYAPVTRIRQLERAASDLRGAEGSLRAQIARSGEAIGEARMRSLALGGEQLEGVAEQLRTTQAQLDEITPKLRAARGQVSQATIRAPASGQVVGLTAFTVGGVVGAGQTLMEIVPDNAALVIQAQVAPSDADDLVVGQETEVRFSSLHERRLPILKGRLTKLSADAYTDDKGRQFYRAEVSISPENLKAIKRVRGNLPGVRPGLPVEVIVPLRNRTALAYLMEPLGNALWRSFREN